MSYTEQMIAAIDTALRIDEDRVQQWPAITDAEQRAMDELFEARIHIMRARHILKLERSRRG